MASKYSKAPISELVFGVLFNSNVLLNNGIIFKLLIDLISDFPNINSHPVSPEEDVVNSSIQASLDYSKTGFVTYRLISEDAKWHVLVQQNRITLHWVRQDSENVGNYPGFDYSFQKFRKIYDRVKHFFSESSLDFDSSLRGNYLCYNDRANIEEFKNSGLQLSEIIKLTPPYFEINKKYYVSNNYFNRYSTPCEEINGNSIISINTPTIIGFGQLIIVENRLIGLGEDRNDILSWYKIAHDIQVSFFENIFTEQILKSWE